MAEIEIGEIVIGKPEPQETYDFGNNRFVKTGKNRAEVRVTFRAGNDGEMVGNFGLLMEMHPELEAHCDAIRAYMKQEARRLLGD